MMVKTINTVGDYDTLPVDPKPFVFVFYDRVPATEPFGALQSRL